MSAVLRLAKAGPSSFKLENNRNERKPTLGQRLFERHCAGGLAASVVTAGWTHEATHDLVFSKAVTLHASNSVNSASTFRKWRVSMASSAHRTTVSLVAENGLCSTPYSYGDFADADAMADRTTKILGGMRTPGQAGGPAGQQPVPAIYFNSGQQKTNNVMFINALGGPGKQEVCTSKIWERAWHSYFMLRLGSTGAPTVWTWANRFQGPASTALNLGGLNHYEAVLSELTQGMAINLELRSEDLDLYPMLCYLFGSGRDTFTLNWGDHDGNPRNPHLREVNPDLLPYHIYFADRMQPLPAGFEIAQPAFAGLPAQAAANNEPVAAINENLLLRAMKLVAECAPIKEDCEAAFWSQLIAVWAELFAGVAHTHVTGMDANHAGWDGFCRSGEARMPGGSHVCNLLTDMTKDSVTSRSAKVMVTQLVELSANVTLMRTCAETLLVGFQRGARQCGATAPIFFSGYDPANFVANVAGGGNELTLAQNAAGYLLSATPDMPSVFWSTVDAMMVELYDARLPYPLLFYGIGNVIATADACPYSEEVPVYYGECLNSVHPVQLAQGLLGESAKGLAAMPIALETMAAEMTFKNVGNNKIMLVTGTTGSSETEEAGLCLDAGVNMLGHSIILRRDDNVQGAGHFRMALMAAPRPGVVSSILLEFEVFPRQLKRAFVPTVANVANGWDRGVPYQDDHLELFSDFDHLALSDLQLGLDANLNNGFEIANNTNMRSMLPGYASLSVGGARSTGVTGLAGVATFPRRVRRRMNIGDIAHGNGGGDDANANAGNDANNAASG